MKLNRRTNVQTVFVPPPARYRRRHTNRPMGRRDDEGEFDTILYNDELYPKQRKFVMEYVQSYNGYKAALAAGYGAASASTKASQLLKEPKIIKAIRDYETDLSTRFVASRERIMKELSLLAYSDLQDYLDENGDIRIKNLRDLPPQVSRAIKKVKFSRYVRTDKQGTEHVTETTDFELHDKKGSLIDLGKEIGMFRERKELTGADGSPLFPSTPSTIIFDFGSKQIVDEGVTEPENDSKQPTE